MYDRLSYNPFLVQIFSSLKRLLSQFSNHSLHSKRRYSCTRHRIDRRSLTCTLEGVSRLNNIVHEKLFGLGGGFLTGQGTGSRSLTGRRCKFGRKSSEFSREKPDVRDDGLAFLRGKTGSPPRPGLGPTVCLASEFRRTKKSSLRSKRVRLPSRDVHRPSARGNARSVEASRACRCSRVAPLHRALRKE